MKRGVAELKRDDPVRLGLIGCGNFSGVLAKAIKKSKKAELITCFDVIPENRKWCSETFGCDQEESYEDVLKRDDIEGVLLVTPNAIHAEQVLLAAQRGKHIYVEKPIANTIDDGKKIIEACKKAGRILMVGHYFRRDPGNRKAKELIDKGVIGKPIMVEANASGPGGFKLTPNKFRWYGDDSGCPSGMLMTSGIHHVEVFNYLLGPIKTVFSYFNKLYIPAEVEDVTGTICQFESGILGYVGANYASPWARWMYIYGTEANLSVTVSNSETPSDAPGKKHGGGEQFTQRGTRVTLFEKGKDAREIPLGTGDSYLEEIEEFAHCIQTGNPPETDGYGALVALAFIRAAIESARTGKPVEIRI